LSRDLPDDGCDLRVFFRDRQRLLRHLAHSDWDDLDPKPFDEQRLIVGYGFETLWAYANLTDAGPPKVLERMASPGKILHRRKEGRLLWPHQPGHGKGRFAAVQRYANGERPAERVRHAFAIGTQFAFFGRKEQHGLVHGCGYGGGGDLIGKVHATDEDSVDAFVLKVSDSGYGLVIILHATIGRHALVRNDELQSRHRGERLDGPLPQRRSPDVRASVTDGRDETDLDSGRHAVSPFLVVAAFRAAAMARVAQDGTLERLQRGTRSWVPL